MPTSQPPANPLFSAEQLQQIAQARIHFSKIRRAVRVAQFDVWTTGIFGGLTLLLSIFSPLGLLLGAGMCMVAWAENRFARQLRQLDRTAPRRLAINQVILAALLFSYGAIKLVLSYYEPASQSAATSDPQIDSLMANIQNITRIIYIAVYIVLMFVAMIGPGLTALFYLTRTRHIDAYLKTTPPWILELQQAGMSL